MLREKGLGNDNFCWCGKMFDYYTNYSCINPGIVESYCKSTTKLLLKGNCNKLLTTITLSSCN